MVSKVYYHLGSYEDSLNYALGAGKLFDVTLTDQFVDTTVAKCINSYTAKRVQVSWDLDQCFIQDFFTLKNTKFLKNAPNGQTFEKQLKTPKIL